MADGRHDSIQESMYPSSSLSHIPMRQWNDTQLEFITETVLNEKGFIPNFSFIEPDSMKYKWRRIRLILADDISFANCELPRWDFLYREYKVFRRDLIKFYEINPETMKTAHLKGKELKEWASLMISMEKYRVMSNQVSTSFCLC